MGFGLSLSNLSGLPEACHLGVDILPDILGFLVGEVVFVQRLEVVGDRAELGLDRPAAGFGRVGGECRLDQHIIEDALDAVGVDIGLGQRFDGSIEAVVEGALLGACPHRPDAFALLGEVDELEVGGERPGDLAFLTR